MRLELVVLRVIFSEGFNILMCNRIVVLLASIPGLFHREDCIVKHVDHQSSNTGLKGLLQRNIRDDILLCRQAFLHQCGGGYYDKHHCAKDEVKTASADAFQ